MPFPITDLLNSYSNYSSIQTFTDRGAVDYTDLLDLYEGDIYSTLEQDAGYILTQNLQDRSYRTGLSIAGWQATDAMRKAVEWWEFDWEYAYSPVSLCKSNIGCGFDNVVGPKLSRIRYCELCTLTIPNCRRFLTFFQEHLVLPMVRGQQLRI